jgi:hypothetical protein
MDDQRGRDQDHLAHQGRSVGAGAALTRNSDEKTLRFFEGSPESIRQATEEQVTIRLEEPALAYFKSLGSG